jgi:hypothetical protein
MKEETYMTVKTVWGYNFIVKGKYIVGCGVVFRRSSVSFGPAVPFHLSASFQRVPHACVQVTAYSSVFLIYIASVILMR